MTFWIFIIVGLVCGFIDSSLGMGYGVSSTTILIMFGIQPALASASVHTSEGFVDLVSGICHYKLGNIERGLLTRLIVPGIVGAILGALFLSMVSLEYTKPYMSLVLLGMGIIILFRFLRKKIIIQRKLSKRYVPLLGFAAAFIDVSGGGGWGPLLTPVFLLGGSEPRKAVGTVEITEPIISFTATITFGLTLGFESFLWSIVLPVMLGGFILTPIAAWLTKKTPTKLLGILVGSWLIILNLTSLLRR